MPSPLMIFNTGYYHPIISVGMTKQRLQKWLFLLFGTICLVLAYIGTVMPGIPGTPFILLTAFFYFRSSDRMYNWLRRQKLFGRLIREYEKNSTVPLRLRIMVLIPFWISIFVAEIIFVKTLFYGITLAVVAIIISLVVIFVKRNNNNSE
jgi:uncharacterized membrane protein YbaN (DUF454 family)